MTTVHPFAMVCCHQGAEAPLKTQLAATGWRLAFSRPGFVSFKHSSDDPSRQLELPRNVFARTSSWSLGNVVGDRTAELTERLLALLTETVGERRFDQLHLWARDRLPAGERNYEPGFEPLTHAIAEDVHRRLAASDRVTADAANRIAEIGESVLDVVLVEPTRWMIGWHSAEAFPPSRWPGGFPPIDFAHDVVSRAYFKAAEAILWSGLPIKPGDVAVEIGSAPGGAAQRLLELGLRVIGVDPAEMDPRVLEHPGFTHLQARGGDLKRSEYQSARWLLVDSNVRPDKTLVTVGNIVGNRRVSIEGMLLTLKIGRYDQADRIPGWCQTIRGWGYSKIEVRQLATGRCEVCIAARR
ncbi:SAM-dependent methyltransferase [Candidatus Laterigemmans baculatus]|uniref:SAM-dependent methyltransferase n=1 Tax=Candidatus Laterigemmans baculatus TaxID=2770505 RepID=UPI0013D99B55|nr:SAM-dependent methyltransferase [Candidatus Laterigemmans baculatus]